MNILVTGASGQLGRSLQALVTTTGSEYNFVFMSSADLDITDAVAVHSAFEATDYAYCINCAAYTAVDMAETEIKVAQKVNVTGPRNLALSCNETHTVLIHISTDFVFDGFLGEPYKEDDIARPIGSYGDSKYKGEQAIINKLDEHFILRTSWLYSEFGTNFMKTMLRLGQERNELSVIYDQIGSPTYAKDLAMVILRIIDAHSIDYGVYHYSNEGVASWYDFARAIFDEQGMAIRLKPIRSEEYPTPAERPKYSVLDKEKIKKTFQLSIPHWRESLSLALKAYAKLNV